MARGRADRGLIVSTGVGVKPEATGRGPTAGGDGRTGVAVLVSGPVSGLVSRLAPGLVSGHVQVVPSIRAQVAFGREPVPLSIAGIRTVSAAASMEAMSAA
jgi:hypothetical protein